MSYVSSIYLLRCNIVVQSKEYFCTAPLLGPRKAVWVGKKSKSNIRKTETNKEIACDIKGLEKKPEVGQEAVTPFIFLRRFNHAAGVKAVVGADVAVSCHDGHHPIEHRRAGHEQTGQHLKKTMQQKIVIENMES